MRTPHASMAHQPAHSGPSSLWRLVLVLLTTSLFTHAVAASDSGAEDALLNSIVARQNNQSLLWGPYRPNLYFGLRPRIPQSLMTGLMWGKVDTYNDFHNSQSPQSLCVPAAFDRACKTARAARACQH